MPEVDATMNPEFALFLQSMEIKAAQKSQASNTSYANFGRDGTLDMFAQEFLAVR